MKSPIEHALNTSLEKSLKTSRREERERERGREKESEKERERETDRQTDREIRKIKFIDVSVLFPLKAPPPIKKQYAQTYAQKERQSLNDCSKAIYKLIQGVCAP
jgi:hypothetical protein